MANKPTITREAILDAAYARAKEDGVAALGVRTIANDCQVSVGTIYNYFPDKAELVTEVVGRFWRTAIERANASLRASAPAAGDGEAGAPGVVDYCRSLYTSLTESLRSFKASWLREISSLDARTRQRTHAAEGACFKGIERQIEAVIDGDPRITTAAREQIDNHELAVYIWRAMFGAIKAGDGQADTLFALMELALYR